MKTKPLFTAALLMATLLIGSTAMAKVDRSQVALGGIPMAAPMSYVRSIYGEPDRTESKHAYKTTVYDYYYGKGVHIYSMGTDRANVINVTANNGWTTPAGVAVGMSETVLTDVYGKADYIEYYKGTTLYEYQLAPYSGPPIMIFGVENGKITSISVGNAG